jgi:hypothetical protein
MQRLHYSGDELLTGTEIARAVIDYAAMLAKNASSARIEIPVRRDDGAVVLAQMLVGPASQLAAESEVSDYEEIVDPELVAELRMQTEQLSGLRMRGDQDIATADDFELTEMIEQASHRPEAAS